MEDDPLDYLSFYRDALRGVMRKALDAVAEGGLPGEHHFHITFRTDHPGVRMPASLRALYPDEMAIVLQYVFYNLEVDDEGFSVTLSFNRIQQRLAIPFEAVTVFQDPHAGIVLPFEEVERSFAARTEGTEEEAQPEMEPRAEPEPRDEGEEPLPAEQGGKSGNVIAFGAFQDRKKR